MDLVKEKKHWIKSNLTWDGIEISTNSIRKPREKTLVIEHMKKLDYPENRDKIENWTTKPMKRKGMTRQLEGFGDYKSRYKVNK